MENRIRRIEVYNRSLDPISAEVWFSVLPEHHNATTEVRGRLMGPRCLYSSTVEVAYPLRPVPISLAVRTLARSPESFGLSVRVVIPEASLWEPQCPFLYEGPIELWQDGRRCDRIIVSHGLRSLQQKENGLSINGRPLSLRGRRIDTCTDQEATLWHQAGYNLLIAPVAASSIALWEQADRFGFLMLGQLGEDADEKRRMEMLNPHTSCLGWLRTECRTMSAEEAVAWYAANLQSEPRP